MIVWMNECKKKMCEKMYEFIYSVVYCGLLWLKDMFIYRVYFGIIWWFRIFIGGGGGGLRDKCVYWGNW